tara:strand:- start:3651 stop:3941 length:291 start_codon:yes stop_codon:yes gene_type:complete
MDINLIGIQEPKGFDDKFNNGFPITDRENNEIEVPYYESDYDDESSVESYLGNCDVDSEYASSDESAAPKRVVAKFNRSKTKYKNVLTVEDDFIPE